MAQPQQKEKKITVIFDPPLKGNAPNGTSATEVKATMTEAALAPAPSGLTVVENANPYHMDVQRVVYQTRAIQQVMRDLMRPGVHYGVIPGTEKTDKAGNDISKPSLWQPGADILCMLFRLRPEYKETITEREGFYGVLVRTHLIHIPTGEVWGEGLGSANSRETRYLNQVMRRVCPSCGKPTIFKSRDPGGGWFCWKAKEGCGTQFPEGDQAMSIDRAQLNPDKVCDLHNTILKIGCKRSKVGGVLTATAASEIFTQDLEDMDIDDQPSGDSKAGAPGVPRPGAPAAKAAAAAPPAGPKRASPIQVRGLNIALMNLEVGVKDANDMDLRGRDREEAIAASRLHWVCKMLDRKVASMTDLSATDAESLIGAAQAGEMPPPPKPNDKQDTGGIS
jgi:hypothetical protein